MTLFGAATSLTGSDAVRPFFGVLAPRFSDCSAYRFELVAAGVSGDLAYTVGYEHTTVSIDGVPVAPYTLRRPTCTAARTASGRSSTATPTLPRSTRHSPARCGGSRTGTDATPGTR